MGENLKILMYRAGADPDSRMKKKKLENTADVAAEKNLSCVFEW